MKVVWTRRAERDLDEIFAYIAADNLAAARALLKRLVAAGNFLAEFPLKGQVGGRSETRELPIAGTSYVLLYDVTSTRGQVDILRCLHGARRR